MALTYIDPQEAQEAFEEMLNGGGPVYVAGYVFYPADILLNCDPHAYREEFNYWLELHDYTTYEQEATDFPEDEQDD